jgi:hypothetical protein
MTAQDLLDRLEGISYSEQDAVELINSAGFICRITKRNGKPYICTRDYKIERINLEIENDKVVAAHIG